MANTKTSTKNAAASTKATKKVVEQAPSASSTVEPASVPAPAPSKAEKPAKKASKKAVAPVVVESAPVVEDVKVVVAAAVPEPVAAAPTPAPVTEEEAATAPVNQPVDTIATRFVTLIEKLNTLATETRELTSLVRGLQKDHAKFVRDNQRNVAKRQNKTKRVASGFAKPTLLSDEMYAFLEIPKGDVVARNDVTRKLNQYVVTNNLRDDKDKRRILPDAKLKKLLNMGEGEQLTYFNIQKYIKHHFVKPVTAA